MSDAVVRPTYAFEGFQLDAQHRVLSRASGEPIPLAPKVFDTLLYFVERPGQLIAKRDLLEAIWPHVVVEENNLNQAISTLRRALGETPGTHRFIVTEPGRGYRLVAPVTTISPSRAEAAAPNDGETAATRTLEVKSGWPHYAAAVLAVLALAGAWAWLADRGPPAGSIARESARNDGAVRAVLPNSVAVLPLANLTPGPDQAAYADGMHAEIIHQLGNLRNVNVIAREAVLHNVGNLSLAELARDLGVQSILTGTFQYVNGRVRVSMQLVDPASNRNVWGQVYEEAFEDVFSVQADIATRVAEALGAQLTAEEQRRMEMRPTTSGEAYAIYLLALNHDNSFRRNDALSQLERAVEIDPAFSLAYGKLALLYALSLFDQIGPAFPIAPSELVRRVSENAQTALNLDPESGSAYTALGVLNSQLWRWSEAEARYATGFASNPNDLELLNYYAFFQSSRGQYREAIPMAKRILELSPPASNAGSLSSLWAAHVYSGNVDAALEVLNDALTIDPADRGARLNLGFINARRGDTEGAARAFRRFEESTEGRRHPTNTAGLAYGYSRIGYADEAKRLFEEIESVADERSIGASTWVLAYLAIGAEQQALEWFDRLLEKIENHEPDAGWFNSMVIKHNHTGDPVLEEARFKERRDRIRGT
jgi:TolB-like protein/DNA-binding winged helix-turn-helix (wHTH) protein/Flp pilus assembly protein TadD